VVTVAVVMAVMMVATAMPALAAKPSPSNATGHGNNVGAASSSTTHNGREVRNQGKLRIRNEAVHYRQQQSSPDQCIYPPF
jgi:hypothetical protein